MMASENRAHALGRTYPGGLAGFVAEMNHKARSSA
jgi:D-alanyl-D-alanine endopeptidase (penicillin-binding protein 7)